MSESKTQKEARSVKSIPMKDARQMKANIKQNVASNLNDDKILEIINNNYKEEQGFSMNRDILRYSGPAPVESRFLQEQITKEVLKKTFEELENGAL